MVSESEQGNKGGQARPRLRRIELLPAEIEGKASVCLRDPQEVAPDVLFLPEDSVSLLALLDGEMDLDGIREALSEEAGEEIALEMIQEFIQFLDDHLFMEGPNFEHQLEMLTAKFSFIKIRPNFLAGKSYPNDPVELAIALDSYLREESGDGALPKSTPKALAAPHIDFERGSSAYAKVYGRLDSSDPPDLVIILGTAHAPIDCYLSLCLKDFQTPLGKLPLADDPAKKLLEESGGAIASDQFVHRSEHSIEFQAVWLKKIFQSAPDMKILPFLSGSFLDLIDNGHHPLEVDEYLAAMDPLKNLIKNYDQGRVMIAASVDLSHVGPQFGDDFKVTDEVQARIREYDLALLKLIEMGNYREFYSLVAKNEDRSNVCGLASIYNMLYILDGPEGKLITYDQWCDPDGNGLVSFAGMIF